MSSIRVEAAGLLFEVDVDHYGNPWRVHRRQGNFLFHVWKIGEEKSRDAKMATYLAYGKWCEQNS